MTAKLRASIAAIILSLTARPALAQSSEDGGNTDDLDLVRLLNVEVSTATKTAESLDEAPAVITVVTRDDIHAWGYRSLAEVLSHTVGFYLVNDQILPNAGVRGMTGGLGAESGVIKVMIDGRSVAYRTTSGNWLGVELVPLESVAQIEIIRGPASALYGADAFLGVVNIITIKPDALRPISARMSTGLAAGHPQGQIDIVGGGQSGRFDWLVGAAGELADHSGLQLPSQSPAPTLPSYVGNRRNALNLERRSLVLQTRLGYRDAERGHLILSAYGSGIERGGDFAHWAQLTNGVDANGRDAGTTVGLQQLRLNLDALLHVTKQFDLAVQSTYFQGGLLPSDRVEIASDLFYIRRKQSYRGVDATVEARYVPTSKFNIIVGVENIYDREQFGTPSRVNRLSNAQMETPGATDRQLSLFNIGTYVSSNLKLLDPWLKVTGGLRYDRHSEYGDNISGRFGLTSQLHRTLVAKALYGSAFKAPSPYLLYASPLRPGDVVGNPRLLPQYIHTVEYQMSFKPSRHFSVTSGVSYNWLQDKAEFTPQGINLTARNVASQRSLTWESRISLRHYDDYVFYTGFELLHSIRELGQEGYAANLVGTTNVVYPPWISRSGLRFSVPSTSFLPLQLGAEAVVVGPRRAFDTSIVEYGSNLTFPTYCMLDTFISTHEVYFIPGHETRFALRARNLLAAKGPNPGFSGFEYPLDPSAIFAEVIHTY